MPADVPVVFWLRVGKEVREAAEPEKVVAVTVPFTSRAVPGFVFPMPNLEFTESQKRLEDDPGAVPAPPPYKTCPAVYAPEDANALVDDAYKRPPLVKVVSPVPPLPVTRVALSDPAEPVVFWLRVGISPVASIRNEGAPAPLVGPANTKFCEVVVRPVPPLAIARVPDA